MATGDITIVVTVEGGSAKTATVPSATRVNALAWMNRDRGGDDGEREPNLTDATYSVHIANNTAKSIIHAAEKQITQAAKPSTPTFTAAT
tara:strand:- start:5 stop:274 length:270 start_codon:yes stop_codon:yes gene_type:complete